MSTARYGRGAERRRSTSPPTLGRGVVGSTVIPGLTTTVPDRVELLKKLNTELRQLVSDVLPARTSEIQLWWDQQGKPLVEEFNDFYNDRKDSWFTNWRTDWDAYTNWQDRIVALRDAARERLARSGVKLTSPEPSNVPRTPWDPHGGFFDGIEKDLKTTFEIGGIAIGGLIVLSLLNRK